MKQTANGLPFRQRVIPRDGCTRFIDVKRDATIPENLESLRARLQCELHAATEHDYFASVLEQLDDVGRLYAWHMMCSCLCPVPRPPAASVQLEVLAAPDTLNVHVTP
jgi:hypothetical protein